MDARNKFEEHTSMMGSGVAADAELWIDGLLEKGSVTTFAGAPATGKTALMLKLTKSVMTGEPFYDMNVVNTTNVLWLQYDSTHNQFERYCTRYCPDLRFEASTLSSRTRYSMQTIGDTEALIDYCYMKDTKLIIMDSLSSLSRGYDENNNHHMDEVYEHFTKFANADISTIILHHMAKSDYGPQKNIRGASSILASTHNAWTAVRSGKIINFGVEKSREFESRHLFSYKMSKFDVEILSKGDNDVVSAFSTNPTKLSIVQSFIKKSGQATRREVLEHIGGNDTKGLQSVLEEIVALPNFKKVKSGRGDAYKYVGNE